jgi:hypothetical protein
LRVRDRQRRIAPHNAQINFGDSLTRWADDVQPMAAAYQRGPQCWRCELRLSRSKPRIPRLDDRQGLFAIGLPRGHVRDEGFLLGWSLADTPPGV